MRQFEICNKDQFNHPGLKLVVSRLAGQYEPMIMPSEGDTELESGWCWVQHLVIDEEGLISMIGSSNTYGVPQYG